MSEPEFRGDKPTGKMRTFRVTIVGDISIDQSVFDQAQLDEPFFSPAPSDTAIVEHIAFNTFVNGLDVSDIDGYANVPDASVQCNRQDVDVEADELIATDPKSGGGK